MSACFNLSTDQILDAFTDEVTSRGGKVTDTFHHGQRLFARSILNLQQDVRPRDRLQGGVALKATSESLSVHPFLFRQVCKNGAVMPQMLATERLEHLDWGDPAAVLDRIRAVIGQCCEPEAFDNSVGQMRSALDLDVDEALMMLPMLAHLSDHGHELLLEHILERYFRDSDHSRFALIQAVTSVARDTEDPALRWGLEELGGSLAEVLTHDPSDARQSANRNAPAYAG